jgi:thymidylate synthase (FAD)
MKMAQPSVVLISRPSLDIDSVEEWLRDLGLEWVRSPLATPAEELIELSGRLCYMSFGTRQSPRSNREYIYNLIRQGHESVLEHASWTFLVSEVSRGFTHQLVRHRVGFAFSQLSQQYVDQKPMGVIMPRLIRESSQSSKQWTQAVEVARQAYQEILESLEREVPGADDSTDRRERRRAVRSAARSVLPEATDTRISVSANARAIRHFLRVRGSIVGDEEMRAVAARLLEIVRKEAPAVFADFDVRIEKESPLVRQVSLPPPQPD